MPSTDPKEISSTLHLIRAAIASGLIGKEEVIDWAVKIVTTDEKPDIFFIDLALSSSKDINGILFYINDFLNFENQIINGRPLLGHLYRKFANGHFDLERTIAILFRLKSEAIFTENEVQRIYTLDDGFDLAKSNTYGTFEEVKSDLTDFLSIYKDYTIDNFEKWSDIDESINVKII